MDEANYLGDAVLELSNLLIYDLYYDKLKPYFKQENNQLLYMDTDSCVLSMKTESNVKDLKNLENMFDFCNLNKKHELFSNENKK